MQRAKIKMKRCALDDAVTDLELLRKHGNDVGDVNHLVFPPLVIWAVLSANCADD